jgi:hypothetical protein
LKKKRKEKKETRRQECNDDTREQQTFHHQDKFNLCNNNFLKGHSPRNAQLAKNKW